MISAGQLEELQPKRPLVHMYAQLLQCSNNVAVAVLIRCMRAVATELTSMIPRARALLLEGMHLPSTIPSGVHATLPGSELTLNGVQGCFPRFGCVTGT